MRSYKCNTQRLHSRKKTPFSGNGTIDKPPLLTCILEDENTYTKFKTEVNENIQIT